MAQPEGFDDGSGRLKRSLYELKQAPRAWKQRFSDHLTKLGLKSTNDRCIFCKHDSGFIVTAIYVDDTSILSETRQLAIDLVNKLRDEFEVHMIESSRFLGFQYMVHESGDVSIHQAEHIRKYWNDMEWPIAIRRLWIQSRSLSKR